MKYAPLDDIRGHRRRATYKQKIADYRHTFFGDLYAMPKRTQAHTVNL